MNGIRVSILALILSICQAETLPVLRGRVESESAFLGNEYSVELEERSRSGPRYEAQVAYDGSFEIRDVVAGQYTMRLLTLRGDTAAEQLLDVRQFVGQISIRLPRRASALSGAATVSVRELQRPIPEKAFRAFVSAQHYVETGRDLDAVH